MEILIKRRIGPDPHSNGQKTHALEGCPDLFELQDGDFLVIGIDVTEEAKSKLPSSAGCGPDAVLERFIIRCFIFCIKVAPIGSQMPRNREGYLN
jgi:hypothetical protein